MLGNLRDFMNHVPIDDADKALELLAQHIVRERVAVAAILFFETMKPLGFLTGQTAIAATPILGSFIEPLRLERYATLLGDRAFVERLIQRIEALESDRLAAKTSPATAAGIPSSCDESKDEPR
jgi:hypothetical protein